MNHEMKTLCRTPSVVGCKDGGVWVFGDEAEALLETGCAVAESKRLLGVSEYKLNGQLDAVVQQTMLDLSHRSTGLTAAFEQRDDTNRHLLTVTCRCTTVILNVKHLLHWVRSIHRHAPMRVV